MPIKRARASVILFLLAVACFLVYWFIFAGARISIVNSSNAVIKNVHLAGRGFEKGVGDLASGESTSAIVHPRGESSVIVSWDTQEGRKYTDMEIYIENDRGYCYTITFTKDHTVRAELCK